jgi:hypothetical protein
MWLPRPAGDRRSRLCDWWPSVLTGLLQTQDYARALIDVVPGTTPETAAARLANRMERQRRLLGRDTPPKMTFIIDELALYRCVGTADVMAAQLSRLRDAAATQSLALRFDSLRGECMKVSESAALLERMAEQWATGVSPLTQTATAAHA